MADVDYTLENESQNDVQFGASRSASVPSIVMDVSAMASESYIDQKFNDLIQITDEQPQSEDNKLWIVEGTPSEYTVPLYSELEDVKNAVDDMELTSLSALPEVVGSPNEAGTSLIGTLHRSVILPVKSGDKLSITGVSAYSIIVFAKSYSGSTIVPSSATGYTTTKYIGTSKQNHTVPSDVNYLVISKYTVSSGVITNRLPTKFVMNGYDYTEQANRNIFDIIDNVNDIIDEDIPSEINSLKNQIDLSTWADNHYVNMSQVLITEGQYILQNGDIGTNSAMAYTDYIEISDSVNSVTVNRVIHGQSGSTYPQDYMVWWYDSNKTLLGVGGEQIKVGSLLTSTKHPSYYNAKYIRVNLSMNNVDKFVWLDDCPSLKFIRYYTSDVDIHSILTPGYYAITGTNNVTNLPKTIKGLLTVKKPSFDGYTEQTYSCEDGLFMAYTRNGSTWTDWFEIIDRTKLIKALGKIGSYNGAFTQTESLYSDIVLEANKSYLIKFNTARTDTVNVYGTENASNYKRVYPWINEVVFTNDSTERNLAFYNPHGQTDTINVDVYTADSLEAKTANIPTVYRVTQIAVTGDYTSLSKCLLDLKDDNNPKIIEIWEGDYDIYAEYQELYSAGLLEKYQGTNPATEYFDYCVWVPNNTHIIGKGIVRLKWEPTAQELVSDEMTAYQTRCVSTLNVAGAATIENVEIYSKNGRYCLHNDGLGKPEFTGAVQKYINCRFYKYFSDIDGTLGIYYGFHHTIGFGIDRSQNHIYENCFISNYAQQRAFYGHNRLSVIAGNNESPSITITNCIIDAFMVYKCHTAVTTPGSWTGGTNWSNAIQSSSVTELEIYNMIANAKPWSEQSTYDVNDTVVLASSECVKFGNGNTNANSEQIRTLFNNCCIKGRILSALEGAEQDCKNVFDIQFLNCGSVSIQIKDPSNQYPPQAYNTDMTIVS